MEVLSRRLVIGLGVYGSLVADKVRLKIADGPQGESLLSSVLDFQSGKPPFLLTEASNRRAVRDEFLLGSAHVAVFEEIEKAVSSCCKMPSVGQNVGETDDCLSVFIVADLADPFAGGLFLDVARMVQVASMGRKRSIAGLLGLGLFLSEVSTSPAVKRMAYSNVCACLRELDFVMDPGSNCDFIYGPDIPDAPRSRVFNQCFLISEANRMGSIANIDQHARFTSRFLYDFCRGEFLRRVVSFPGSVQNAADAPRRPMYSSFGIASVFFPRKGLYAYCMEKWARDVKDRVVQEQSLSPLPTDAEAAFQAINAFLGDDARSVLSSVKADFSELPVVSIPGANPASEKEAAEIFLGIIERIAKEGLSEELPEHLVDSIKEAVLIPFAGICRQQIQKLLENNIPGLGLSRVVLCSLHDPGYNPVDDKDRLPPVLTRLLPASDIRLKNARDRAEKLVRQLSDYNLQIQDNAADHRIPDRPSFLRHPILYRKVVNEEKGLQDWVDSRCGELNAMRDAIRDFQFALFTNRIIHSLVECVELEKIELQRLEDMLGEVVSSISDEFGRLVPQPIGVDKSLVAQDNYEMIYANCLCNAGPGNLETALKEVIIEEKLLRDFRKADFESFAGKIKAFGNVFFEQVKAMGIDKALEDQQVRKAISGVEDILKNSWLLTDPLIDTGGGLLPDGWNIAELRSLSLPEVAKFKEYSPSLFASFPGTHLSKGSPTSIRMCCVIHGFTLDTVRILRSYASSYNALKSKEEVHIFDEYDKLPPLPQIEQGDAR